ncbi:MAG: glycosyl transferase [Elainella sp. Prado103]|nr:glycosyl transferase [Elainella sp. Prado103]
MIANSQPSRLQQWAKTFKLGTLLYRTYYRPKGFLQKCQRRGFINMAIDRWSCQRMEAAAYRLPPVNFDDSDETFNIYFLSGRKFWYQTCFCAYSLVQLGIQIRPIVYDDGSLTQKYANEIRRVFPNVKIVSSLEIGELLDQYLPVSQFPYLRERRSNYPNLRKLTDIHLGSGGWKLVLDSDMLFFHPPTFILNWLRSPQQPCYMVDTETSYGYSDALMSSLAQAQLPDRLNVGICGLNSHEIDWEKLEFWCKTLIEQEGTHYYQEQALIAMLLADQSCAIAPAEDYIVMPDRNEVIQPQAVLHHYVSDAKTWYFRYGWKHII